jgi:hypothetical protein
MITSPDFSIRHYLPDDAAGASQPQPPPATSSQQHIAEATEQHEERESIDSTSSSRRNSIQGHLERLRCRTDFMISGESVIDPIEMHYDQASPKEPVWDWFAMDNVFHRPAPSSRGDFKHLVRPLSPKSQPNREQLELERVVRAYENRLQPAPVEVRYTPPTSSITTPAYLQPSAPVPDRQPTKDGVDKNGTPYVCPPPQTQPPKRKSSREADGADRDDRHKRARRNEPLTPISRKMIPRLDD